MDLNLARLGAWGVVPKSFPAYGRHTSRTRGLGRGSQTIHCLWDLPLVGLGPWGVSPKR
ncbi:hypothetical protein DPMN_160978 [Dreissena polymorpha]|uniref:Uncharacterized protein n=1 Tax=Dreissena polymorpha TaxID=45954 RepID=A0A9D4IP90_DREPO|nr:hypothetical protein DPMN_160978 [Dreissena polymorpha]